jgi:CubicO group peptidase (beta-lactamase class C family)
MVNQRLKHRFVAFSISILALPVFWFQGCAMSRSGRAEDPASEQGDMRMTGPAVPELASFDRIIPDLMRKWGLPGGQVAVMKDGRLIMARGYGWADNEGHEKVEPDSLFRIASMSKSLTAAAILKLVQDGRLTLDQKALAILSDLEPPRGATVDQRIYDITVAELLNHAGGWDRDKSFDPMFLSTKIAAAMGEAAPANSKTIIRYMMGQPLQYDPGTKYAYSNFGYCILGRIIEKSSGQRYEDFVKSQVLSPAGVSRMQLGHTLPSERAPGEVHYYGYPWIGMARSVFPRQDQASWPYGGWYIEAMDSHGGWIASAVDMLRFIRALDRGDIITKDLVQQMTARPAPPLWLGTDTWYGMGWQVRPSHGGFNWWHMGSLDGTSTIMVRAYNGLAWVALFNSRPKAPEKWEGEIDDSLWKAVGEVKNWPSHDLFSQFGR